MESRWAWRRRHPSIRKRLGKMARLVEQIRPESWSEHLAFVRAGDIEIGHLAAPPRTQSTIDSTAENLEKARKTVGSLPLVENIATLIDPPASNFAEPEWLTETVAASGAGMLLDLHNLYANSINFGVTASRLQDFEQSSQGIPSRHALSRRVMSMRIDANS